MDTGDLTQQFGGTSIQSPRMLGDHPKDRNNFPPIPPLQEDDLRNEYVDPTVLKQRGVYFIFINNNCPDAAERIGSFRIRQNDIRKIPSYCARYKPQIKARAVEALNRHIRDNHCAVAVIETLTVDDYSISFELASLSTEGDRVTSGKPGPLSFCHCPGLIQPVLLAADVAYAGDNDYAHVVNVHIHLLDSSKRREQVKKKLLELAQKGPIKRRNFGPNFNPNYNGGYQGNAQSFAQTPNMDPNLSTLITSDLSRIKEKLHDLEKKDLAPAGFPALQPGSSTNWPPFRGQPDLPDE